MVLRTPCASARPEIVLFVHVFAGRCIYVHLHTLCQCSTMTSVCLLVVAGCCMYVHYVILGLSGPQLLMFLGGSLRRPWVERSLTCHVLCWVGYLYLRVNDWFRMSSVRRGSLVCSLRHPWVEWASTSHVSRGDHYAVHGLN